MGGCAACGGLNRRQKLLNKEDALANIKEAIGLVLEVINEETR